MNSILIYNFLSYVLLLFFAIFFSKKNYIAWFVISFYALGAFFSILVPMSDHYYTANIFISKNFSKSALAYLFFTLCVFFFPVLQNGINSSNPISSISHKKNEILFTLSVVYSCFLLASIFLTSFYLLKNGFSFNSFVMSKEDALNNLALLGNWTNVLFKISNTFGDIFLIYAFYILFNYSEKKYAISLIVEIIVFSLLYSMLVLARNSLFHIVFSLIIILILFRMYSNQMIYKLFAKITLFFVILILGLIVFVSVLRFFNDSSGNEYTQFVMLRYAGEPMLNFASWMDRIQNFSFGVKNFSSILSMLHLEPSRTFDEIRDFCYNQSNIPSYIFYTFVGSFVFDFGFYFTFFIALVFAILFSKRNTEYTSFARVSFVYFYALFLVDGYFFFFYASKNVKLLAIVVFLLFLKFSTETPKGCL